MALTLVVFLCIVCTAEQSHEFRETPEKSSEKIQPTGSSNSSLTTNFEVRKTEKECEDKGKVFTNLDLAVQLIRTARDSYPTCSTPAPPVDCEEIHLRGHNSSGVYKIKPLNRMVSEQVDVYCDMNTDGGGWTVIQRRGNFLRPKNYFFQDWQSYKKGFGKVDQDFWLGNDVIFALTNQKLCSVRFDLQDTEGSRRYALYDEFWIDDEDHKYTLHIKGYTGDAGDSMAEEHDGEKFTTKDQDNDKAPDENCAQTYSGAWWYKKCHVSNLNGLYHRGKHETFADGVNWKAWKGYHDSLETTEIKIRAKNYRPQR